MMKGRGIVRYAKRGDPARTRARRENLGFFAYTAPALLFFIVFKYWPIAYDLFLSFFKWNFVSKMKWVGLDNYAQMFKRDSFLHALVNTGAYILALIPFYLVIPLALAVLLSAVRQKRAVTFYRVFFFLPTILAFAIVCLVWMWMFSPSFGLINNLIRLLGGVGFNWLSDPNTALISIVLVSGWKQIGANMILFVAGLMTISEEYIESATIDGASGWQIFWRIKWPLLSPTMLYMTITSVIFAAERAFVPINILTRGGPSETTTNLSHIIYVFGFEFFNMGLASATAIFTAVVFLILTFVIMKGMGGYGYYEN